MRLIETDKLKDGMELGKTIYASNGRILLKQGVILRSSLIESIKKTSCSGVYINDEFSKEIEIKDVVDEELKNQTVQKTKSFFTTAIVSNDLKAISDGMKDIGELITKMMDQIISNRNMMVNLVDLKTHDDYTFQHSVSVAALASVLGVSLGYSRSELTYLAKGALLHDVGKMFVDLKILNKPAKLTPEEFEEMKNHSLYGHKFAKDKLNLTYKSLVTILQHHEKFNGTGYPYGRKGDEIDLNAQIVAICDVFDAITSKRVYHEPVLPSEAIEYIMGNSGQHFAPQVVEVFLRKVAVYPLGICVELSNGAKGLVCENYEGFVMRPKIKVITENKNDKVYIDLKEKENAAITIVKIIPSPPLD